MGKGLRITRKAGERIYIGDNIVVEIESFNNGNAGVRIIAPNDVEIHRDASRVAASKNTSKKDR